MTAPALALPPPLPDVRTEATLVDLLDRLLAGGVVICGELTLTIADVPLVRIDLRALIAPAPAEERRPPVSTAGSPQVSRP
ncbi:gas vesicle protein [Yinghuangia aomiensis]